MTAELDAIYTAEWFAHDFAELRPEFHIIANSLVRQFPSASFARDVGCGPGMILERLLDLGWGVVGYEGSEHGIAYASHRVQPMIRHQDIRTHPGFERCKTQLLICTEVAEHLDAKDAPGLVALLCTAMCPVIFTAAPPGQDGHHHVNCQPKDYWRALFAEHGVIQDHVATQELMDRWAALRRLSHMRNNVMVFV